MPVQTLGTLLRQTIEHLDGAVEKAYVDACLDFRPRYTPVLRVLLDSGPVALRTIAAVTGLTHSAVSQTVSQMGREGLVDQRPGVDGRERVVHMTPKMANMVPAIREQWAATDAAAHALDAELGASLAELLSQTLARLAEKPFGERIADARTFLIKKD